MERTKDSQFAIVLLDRLKATILKEVLDLFWGLYSSSSWSPTFLPDTVVIRRVSGWVTVFHVQRLACVRIM